MAGRTNELKDVLWIVEQTDAVGKGERGRRMARQIDGQTTG